MEYLRASWSDVPVSRIALGCELLGGTDWGTVDQSSAVAAVRRSFDLGVTVFDTADVYGLGRSEELLSSALGRRAAEAIIVTKGGVSWQNGTTASRHRTVRTLDPRYLRSALEASLRRLRVERIPLYLAHWPDGVHDVRDVVATLSQFRKEGLIGAFGLSNFGVKDLAVAGVLEDIDAIEVQHNLLTSNSETVTLAGRADVLPLVYGCLAQGLLTGKYPPGHEFARTDRRHRLAHFAGSHSRHDRLLLDLAEVAARRDLTPAQVAIRWAMDSAARACAVVGARNPGQAEDNAASMDVNLTVHDLSQLTARASRSQGAGV